MVIYPVGQFLLKVCVRYIMKGVNEYGGNEKVLVTICYETAAASWYELDFALQKHCRGKIL